MLYVNTHIANSAIHGIGLFASENIERGTVVCQWCFGFDVSISRSLSEAFPKITKTFLDHFCFQTHEFGEHLLFADNFRFINHGANCNLFTYVDKKDIFSFIALEDIKERKELTIDYSSISMPHYLTLKKDFIEMRDNKPWPPKIDIDKLVKEE